MLDFCKDALSIRFTRKKVMQENIPQNKEFFHVEEIESNISKELIGLIETFLENQKKQEEDGDKDRSSNIKNLFFILHSSFKDYLPILYQQIEKPELFFYQNNILNKENCLEIIKNFLRKTVFLFEGFDETRDNLSEYIEKRLQDIDNFYFNKDKKYFLYVKYFDKIIKSDSLKELKSLIKKEQENLSTDKTSTEENQDNTLNADDFYERKPDQCLLC